MSERDEQPQPQELPEAPTPPPVVPPPFGSSVVDDGVRYDSTEAADHWDDRIWGR